MRIPLRGGKGKNTGENGEEEMAEYVSSDEDEAAAESWEPLPVQSETKEFFISSKRKKTDIISILVNIYGSQDAFLKVYQSMLEERLLSGIDIRQEVELKNLELMKLRFGDQNLHGCDVMLRDIKDSERIRTAIKKSMDAKITHKTVPIGSSNLPL